MRARLGASAERGTAGVVSEAAALIDEYLGSLQIERGASLNTLAAYRRDLKGFESFLVRDRRAIADVGVTDLSRYLGTLRRRGLSGRSIARHLSAVRGLYRFLLDAGRVPRDPTEHLDSPRPAATAAAHAVRGGRGRARRGARHDAIGRAAGPRAARAALRLWAARVRGALPAGRGRELHGGLRDGDREGEPPAARARGGPGAGLGAPVPHARRARASSGAPIPARSSSTASGGRMSRQALWGIIAPRGAPAGCAPRSRRTRCATPSRVICSSAAPTCARCRPCSATWTSRPPRSTPTCRRASSATCTGSSTRGRRGWPGTPARAARASGLTWRRPATCTRRSSRASRRSWTRAW